MKKTTNKLKSISLVLEINENKMENKIITNLDNVLDNYKVLKNKVGSTEVYPILKCEAYSSGAIEVAKLLDCNGYFVFDIGEGMELRKGYKKDIYVLTGYQQNEKEDLIKNNLIPVIETFNQLEYVLKDNIKEYALFFNTGMNRNGFLLEDINKIKELIKNKEPKLIMTHMGCPDNPNHIMSKNQINNFNNISKLFSKKVLKSMFSRNAILNYNNFYYDVARPGIGVVDIETNKNFKDVVEIKSYVKSIKNNIAKIPFGINNGLPETYKNGYVFINNERFLIKKIYLNHMTAKINDKVKLNDEVSITNEKYTIKDITERTVYNNIEVLRQEIVLRMILSKKNKKYYILNNNLIERKTRYKTYKHTKIFNYKDKIESSIFDIIKVNEDGFVGYGATAKVKKGDVLASFYGGYNDGINRYLSNIGYVYVNGCKCKIIGRISMDQTTILLDKSIADKTKIGDKICLYKKDVKNILSSLKEQEIFYMTNHSRRVKQVNK